MKSNHGERCQDPVTCPLSLWPQSLHELLAGRGRGSTGSGAVSGVGLSGPGWELVSCESFGTLAELPFFFKKKIFLICEIEPITPLSSSCYWCVAHDQNERAIWAFSKPRRVTDRACATMIVPPMIVSFGIEDGESSMRRQNQTYSLENCISFVEPTTHFSSSQSCRNFRGPVRR